MSVINQMLRDLDQRQRDPAPVTPPIPALASKSRPRPAPDKRVIVPGLLLLSAALLVAGLYLWQRPGETVARSVPSVETEPAPTSLSEPQEAVNAQPEDEVPETAAVTPVQEQTVAGPRTAAGEGEEQAEFRPMRQPVAAAEKNETKVTVTADRTDTLEQTPVADASRSSTREPAASVVKADERVRASGQDGIWSAEDLRQGVSGTQVPGPVKQPAANKRPETARGPLERAKRFLSQGRLAETEAALRQALADDPAMHEARELLTALLIRGGRTGEASRLVDEGLSVAPAHSAFVVIKARLLVEEGQLEPAVAMLEENVPVADESETRLTLLAGLYRQLGRYEQALASYRKVLGVSPRSSTAWAGLAITLEALGRSDQAREAYRRALVLPGLAPTVSSYARQRLRMLERAL